jgi:hypothetical protein
MSTYSELAIREAFREPLSAAYIMRNFSSAWCICGGWAIDLFVNRVSRSHKDIDIAIWRNDQLALRSYLIAQNWTLEQAVAGQLHPWLDGEFLKLPIHTIWCRNLKAHPNFIEILFNEIKNNYFLFRRALSITYPLERVIVESKQGIPILAPEIVLLYKAKDSLNERNQNDFEVALPYLDEDRCAWLKEALIALHPEHRWLNQL